MFEGNKEQSTKKENPALPKIHHEIHNTPATATTSRRRAMKHVPRVSPYSPASIDPGFVQIGRVQLSQLPMAKTASVASFPRPVFLQQMVQKKEKKNQPITATSNRHFDPHRASIPLLQSCEVALERVSDLLGARCNILPASVGSAPTWSEGLDDISKRYSSCR